eukprot:scpid106763/ scgid13680/ GC-rich sequence DNA-binding factor 1
MSVDVDPYIPLYSKNVMESQQSAPVMFFHRQYWSCFKLLLNVLQWHGILSSGKLQQLCLDGLINRYLLRAIQHFSQPFACVDRCAKVCCAALLAPCSSRSRCWQAGRCLMHLYPMPLAMYVVIMVNICIGYGPCFWITMLGVEALSQRRLCNGLQVLSGAVRCKCCQVVQNTTTMLLALLN